MTARDEALQEIPALKKAILTPKIAWPTMCLAIFVLLSWCAVTGLGLLGELPIAVCTILNGVLAYMSFTVLHDASHHAIAKSARLNNAVGWVFLAFLGPFTVSFPTFRYLHIQHHRFTNDKKHDPDHWVALGPWWIRLFMLATIDFNYFAYYAKRFSTRPKKEKRSVLTYCFFMLCLLIFLILQGHGFFVLWAWILPSRIALFLLALGLDYLPHYPHKITDAEDRYKATSIREGGNWFWSPILLYQNYHLAHHLYPTAPFYRYKKIWVIGRPYFMKKHPYIIDALGHKKD